MKWKAKHRIKYRKYGKENYLSKLKRLRPLIKIQIKKVFNNQSLQPGKDHSRNHYIRFTPMSELKVNEAITKLIMK